MPLAGSVGSRGAGTSELVHGGSAAVHVVSGALADISYDSLAKVFSDPDSLFDPVVGAITGVVSKKSEVRLESVDEAEEEAVNYGDSGDDNLWEAPNSPRPDANNFRGASTEALSILDPSEGTPLAQEVGGIMISVPAFSS